jgi:hypothetical protein
MSIILPVYFLYCMLFWQFCLCDLSDYVTLWVVSPGCLCCLSVCLHYHSVFWLSVFLSSCLSYFPICVILYVCLSMIFTALFTLFIFCQRFLFVSVCYLLVRLCYLLLFILSVCCLFYLFLCLCCLSTCLAFIISAMYGKSFIYHELQVSCKRTCYMDI